MQINIFSRGSNFDSKEKEKKKKLGETKGDNGFRGRPSHHWMMVSIKASVSGLICQYLQIYVCFDCVVINHQKGGDCKEHGPIRPLFCDFGD